MGRRLHQGLAVTGGAYAPPYNVVVALGQGTRPVSAALMQVTLAYNGLSGSSATALGT